MVGATLPLPLPWMMNPPRLLYLHMQADKPQGRPLPIQLRAERGGLDSGLEGGVLVASPFVYDLLPQLPVPLQLRGPACLEHLAT